MDFSPCDTGCNTGGPRPDRPHTFFCHEMGACPDCKTEIEGRVVFRDNDVMRLYLCPSCGQTEEQIGDDPQAYVRAFVGRSLVPEGHTGDWKIKQTKSTCPSCLDLLVVDVVINEGQVFFDKDCPKCGPSRALVSENAEYYVNAYTYARAGTEPHSFANEAQAGCPVDCGSCTDHEQHTCLPIVEVTDYCNLECPVCIVDNQYSTHLDPETFSEMIDTLIKAEGQCESVAISGGEPTSHPNLLELVKVASRPEIGRVVIITNGIRLGRDRAFAQAIKDSGAYIALQLDGLTTSANVAIRGRDLVAEKQAALATLKALDIPTQLIFVAVQGVNDHEIGDVIRLFLSEDHFLSLNFQPMAHTGQGGGAFDHNPLDRITIPGIISRAAAQTDGMLRESDFLPLPCSHPQCVSLTYLLRLDDGTYLPFPRFVDFETHGSLLRSSATLPATAEVQDSLNDIIHDVFSRDDEIERADEVLKALRRSLDVMFPRRPVGPKEALRIGEQQAKSIFIHHYMDAHDFDLERLRKCCHHYPQADGRIMPACGFNLFHRGAALGEGTAVPDWATNAPRGAGTASSELPIVY